MQHILIIFHDDAFQPNPKIIAAIKKWNSAMDKAGVLISGNPLMPPFFAKTIRTKAGEQKVIDGSHSKAKEFISAYVIIDAETMDAAVQIALTHPMAKVATIEVRPIWEKLKG